MSIGLIQLMATVERPGWKWNPWRGVLENPDLRVSISLTTVSGHGVKDKATLLALLVRQEERGDGDPGRPYVS